MGKFFNHYMPDRAVGFAHPYNERSVAPWRYTLGYRGYDLDVERHISLWLVGISLHDAGIARSFGAAKFPSKLQSRGSGARSKTAS